MKKKAVKKSGEVISNHVAFRGQKRRITLSDGTEVITDDVNKKTVKEGGKRIYAQRPDPENIPTPKDEYTKLKYPPPRNNPVFRRYWGLFHDAVVTRPGFNVISLATLQLLCDLYVEIEDVTESIRKIGMTHEVITVTGKMRRVNPEVAVLQGLRSQVQKVSSNLDLYPTKSKKVGKTMDPEDDNEWA